MKESGKSLYIIRSKAEVVSSAEHYLAHHGWTVKSSGVIKDALAEILEIQPNYVLVCLDHTNAKAPLIPGLIEKALGLKTIVYVEETSPRMLGLMSHMDYALFPPITGTAVERMCAKIERDKKRKPSPDKMEILKGGTSEDARTLIRQMIKSEESVAALGSAPLNLKPAGADAGEAVKHMLQAALTSEKKAAEAFAEEVHERARAIANSPIAMSSQRAIDAVARPTSDHPSILAECSEMTTFVIQSQNHQGYVLCAFAKNAKGFASFVDVFRAKLIEFMQEIDPGMSAQAPVQVTVERVRFEDWAKRDAQFVKKFVHGDSECAIAYFNDRIELPELKPTVGGMAEMNLSDVIAEKELNFDVFVHLPLNQKFVLYGKRGRAISGKQKSRLRQRGLKKVHVLETQTAEVVRYWMQDHLDQKITAHKETDVHSDSKTASEKYAA